MEQKKITSIAVWIDDFDKFLQMELEYSAKVGKKVSHNDFFGILVKKLKEIKGGSNEKGKV